MSVYVDKSENSFGRMIMCHMIADTHEELHEMADKIGVAMKWFQADSSTPHYDICKSKRVLALEHGAIDADRREFVMVMRKLRKNPDSG